MMAKPNHLVTTLGTKSPAWMIAILCAIQTCLLVLVNLRTTPTYDEWGHLPAGLSHLETGTFHQYRVNPPLPRILAAIPVRLHGYRVRDWFVDDYQARIEFVQAQAFLRDNGTEALKLFHIARLTMIPWCILGTLLIRHIAAKTYSPTVGTVAAILWIFSPTILTFGATIVPDIPAAVSGMLVIIFFAHWLERPTWTMTLACGAAVGLAFSVKFTWLLLLPILPLTLLAFQIGMKQLRGYQHWVRLFVIFVIAMLFLNLIYAGDRTFLSLSQYQFKSTAFQSIQNFFGDHSSLELVNRIPIPLPENLLRGLDVQKADFEGEHYDSYLFGQWQTGGWWYFYVVAWLIKEPVALWMLFAMGVWSRIRVRRPLKTLEWVMFAVTIPVFVIVSMETGFSIHLRYALPALPAVFLISAGAFSAQQPTERTQPTGKLKWFLLVAFVAASLSVLPRSYSFFSYAVGGPRNGWKLLSDSNLDWGQDLYSLIEWQRKNPEKRPLHVLYSPEIINVNRLGVQADSQSLDQLANAERGYAPLRSGWWAVFAQPYCRPEGQWFRDHEPAEQPSTTLRIFHVTELSSE